MSDIVEAFAWFLFMLVAFALGYSVLMLLVAMARFFNL